ncbi:hypothetical protein [Oxalicibacterium solurbis]|uniref:hypothetical protein n=1 Tax=Oxalicibacterium solurbis TaxID=69280 RepID=UPI001663AE20|nr:hypothetical protein [Oxalicibacterium solurbis]
MLNRFMQKTSDRADGHFLQLVDGAGFADSKAMRADSVCRLLRPAFQTGRRHA